MKVLVFVIVSNNSLKSCLWFRGCSFLSLGIILVVPLPPSVSTILCSRYSVQLELDENGGAVFFFFFFFGVFVYILGMIHVSLVIEGVKIRCEYGWRSCHHASSGFSSMLVERIVVVEVSVPWPLLQFADGILKQQEYLGTFFYPLSLDGVRSSQIVSCLFKTMNKSLRHALGKIFELIGLQQKFVDSVQLIWSSHRRSPAYLWTKGRKCFGISWELQWILRALASSGILLGFPP